MCRRRVTFISGKSNAAHAGLPQDKSPVATGLFIWGNAGNLNRPTPMILYWITRLWYLWLSYTLMPTPFIATNPIYFAHVFPVS